MNTMTRLRNFLVARRLTEGRVLRGAAMLPCIGLLACSGEGDHADGFDGDREGKDTVAVGPCEIGTTKACGVTLERADGRVSCFEGVQTCDASEKWGDCLDGRVIQRADPFNPKHSKWFQTMHRDSTDTDGDGNDVDGCANNPCDPECQIFEEPGPITGGGSTPDWEEGPTPPWTPPAACAVSDLCSTNATPLDSACDACVADICNQPATDHCCTDGAAPTSWDDACVDAVYTVCDGSTPPVGPPNGGFCDFGAFSDGRLRFGNGGLSGTSIGSRGDGPNSGSGQCGGVGDCDIYVETGSPCAYENIVTLGDVNIRNTCTINGDVTAVGKVHFEAGGTVNGNVTAGGHIELRNGVTVNGNLTTAGNTTGTNGRHLFIEDATVTGDALVNGDVTLSGSSAIYTGNIWASGDYNQIAGNRLIGDLFIGGDIYLADGGPTEVTGSLIAIGNIDGQSTADITGTATVNTGSTINTTDLNIGMAVDDMASNAPPVVVTTPPTVELPVVSDLVRDLSIECGIAGAMGPTSVTSDVTWTPRILGNVTVDGGTTDIILRPGNYVFNQLELVNGGSVEFDADGDPNATWDISVCGYIRGGSGHTFGLTGGGLPNPEDVVFYSAYAGNEAIRFYDNNTLSALFLAPFGQIRFYNNNTLDGAMWGDSVYTDTSTTLNQGGVTACENADLFGGSCDGTTSPYIDGAAYVAGDEVHHDGKIYECTGTDCSTGGGHGGSAGFWPGEGISWGSTWTELRDCPGLVFTVGGGVCPITPATYPTLWSTPCSTGRDCQVNHRCDEPVSGSCPHSKCQTGASLTIGCDPCVELICDPDGDGTVSGPNAACCTDTGSGMEWDASCVAAVKTSCDADCGSTTLACEHDMCIEGGGMVQNTACHSCVTDVCAARPSCCTEDGMAATDEWDATCVDLVMNSCGTVGTSICDFGAFGTDDLITGDNCMVSGGALGGDTDGTHTVDYGCTVGDIYAWSNVYLYDSSAGDIYSTGTITLDGTSSAAAQMPSQTMTAPDVPGKSFTCGASPGDDQDFGTADGNHVVAPGDHGLVAIADDGSGPVNSIEFTAGTYNIDELRLGADTKLILPNSGEVEINVCGDISIGAHVEFEGAGAALTLADALRIKIHSNGSNVTILEGAIIYGVVTAPTGDIWVSGPGSTISTYINGMLRGQTTRVHDRVEVNSTGLTGAACHAAGLGEATVVGVPVDACDYSILASGAIQVNGYHSASGESVIGGDIGGGVGAVTVQTDWGERPNVDGSVYSTGTMYLASADITGEAYTTDVPNCTNDTASSLCDGAAANCCTGTSPGTVTAPSKTFTCSGADGTSGLTPTAGGHYSDTGGNWDDVITFEAGTYTFQNFTVQGRTEIVMPATGDVIINVCGNVHIGQNSWMTGVSGVMDSLRLQIYADGNVTLSDGVTFYSAITSESTLTLNHQASLFGLGWAAAVQLNHARIVSTGVAGSTECQSTFGGVPAPVCPVTTPTGSTVASGGACVSNQGYTDPGCPGVDLALGGPCEDSIPICNHGQTDYTGPVDLTFWPENAAQMATEFPDDTYSLGTCSFTGTIPAGECVTHDCSGTGLMTQDMTVMVNAPSSGGVYAVAECSYLDNWSLFVDGEACTDVCLSPPCSGGSANQIVEEYIAICPDDMAPLWGSLAWDTTLPGASDVTFEGSETGGAGTFVALGEASDEGAICSLVGPSPCPVDLTAEMGFGTANHPDRLYLRMTVTPDGADVPTLNDWDVTYTCRYDQ